MKTNKWCCTGQVHTQAGLPAVHMAENSNVDIVYARFLHFGTWHYATQLQSIASPVSPLPLTQDLTQAEKDWEK